MEPTFADTLRLEAFAKREQFETRFISRTIELCKSTAKRAAGEGLMRGKIISETLPLSCDLDHIATLKISLMNMLEPFKFSRVGIVQHYMDGYVRTRDHLCFEITLDW